MSLVKLDIDLDQEEIKKQINEKLDQAIQQTLFFWDINEMSKRTCMSKSYLNEHILNEPAMKVIERSRDKGKRLWPVKESIEVMQQLMDNW